MGGGWGGEGGGVGDGGRIWDLGSKKVGGVRGMWRICGSSSEGGRVGGGGGGSGRGWGKGVEGVGRRGGSKGWVEGVSFLGDPTKKCPFWCPYLLKKKDTSQKDETPCFPFGAPS